MADRLERKLSGNRFKQGELQVSCPLCLPCSLVQQTYCEIENRQVFLRYKKTASNRRRMMVLDVLEYIRRFPQHVLPAGFMKVRCYGFSNAACKVPKESIRTLIEVGKGAEYYNTRWLVKGACAA